MAQVCLLDADKRVVNIVIGDDDYAPPASLTIGPPGGRIGQTWDGSAYLDPPLPPPPAPTADDVRAEAGRRIYARYSMPVQLNAHARAHELATSTKIGIGGVTLIGPAYWTPAETAEAALLQAMRDWIKAMRAASNAMEASPPADYADDSRWPN